MDKINKKALSYIGLFFVVGVWGTSPLVTLHFYKYYSPSIRLFFVQAVLLIAYLVISQKHFREFNIDYIKVGIPTGFFLSIADISQKVGLMYTTPARYAFLENLSCITVPILMYILIKKKSGIITVFSCFLSLASVFILNGISLNKINSWGIGEILCAVSGLLYGFNIAGTGAFAKKLYAPMYLAVQTVVCMLVSFISAVVFNFTTVTNSEGLKVPVEKIVFSFKPEHLIFTIIYVLICNALCWIIRTNSMKHIDAAAVAIIMPFSAVVTGVFSVLTGSDVLNFNLVAGGILGVISVVLSSFDDIRNKKV